MDYTNIFSGMPQQRNEDSPLVSRLKDLQRYEMAAPFMADAKQRSALDLQDAQIKMQEFASSEAREARMLGHKATAAKHTFDAAKAAADFKTLPEETRLKTIKLAGEIQSEQGKPYAQMFESLAGLSDQLDKAPEEHRPLLYKQWADRFQLTSGRPLPDSMKNYRPEILEDAKMVKYALVNTPKYAQDVALKDMEIKGAMDRQREQSSSAANVANINATAAMSRQTQAQEAGRVNIPQRIVQINKEMPSADPERKAILQNELRGYITSEVARVAAHDSIIKGAAGAVAIPGEMGANARRIIAEREQEIARRLYTDYGIPGGPEAPKPKSKYTVGEKISRGGKNYVVVGHDKDGEPLVEEAK